MAHALSAYSRAEREAIAGWLKDGLSASQIAAEFCKRFLYVSRNAIIGIVHRDPALASIGLAAKRRGTGVAGTPKDGRGQAFRARAAIARAATASGEVSSASRAASQAAPAGAPAGRRTGDGPQSRPVGAKMLNPANIANKAESRKSDPVYVPPRALVCEAVNPRAYDAQSLRLPLHELDRGACKFAVNEAAQGETHLFCGHPAEEGQPWCAHHAARVRGAPPRDRSEVTANRLGGW